MENGDPRDVGYVSRPWGQRNSAEGEAFAAALVNTSIALPMVAWFVTLFAGAAFHDGPTRAESVYLPLLQYDRALVRFGPLLPLGPLFLRFFADRSDELAVPTPKRALVVYTMAAGVRLAVYLIGVAFGSAMMSDHLFLGASVLVSAQGEAVASAASLLRLAASNGWLNGMRGVKGTILSGASGSRTASVRASAAAAVACASLVAATTLVGLQCGDAYYTARYFHRPRETAIGGALGLVLCQSIVLIGVVSRGTKSRDCGDVRGVSGSGFRASFIEIHNLECESQLHSTSLGKRLEVQDLRCSNVMVEPRRSRVPRLRDHTNARLWHGGGVS